MNEKCRKECSLFCRFNWWDRILDESQGGKIVCYYFIGLIIFAFWENQYLEVLLEIVEI